MIGSNNRYDSERYISGLSTVVGKGLYLLCPLSSPFTLLLSNCHSFLTVGASNPLKTLPRGNIPLKIGALITTIFAHLIAGITWWGGRYKTNQHQFNCCVSDRWGNNCSGVIARRKIRNKRNLFVLGGGSFRQEGLIVAFFKCTNFH